MTEYSQLAHVYIGGFDSALDLDIEVFCVGEMYHIDGFVHDGDVKLCWPSKYTNPCVDFNNSKYLASYSLLPNNPLTPKLQVHFLYRGTPSFVHQEEANECSNIWYLALKH